MWDHFDVSQSDPSHAICKHCSVSVSRGGKSAAAWTTTTLKNHMVRHHPSIKLTARENLQEPQAQSSVYTAFERDSEWDFNDPRSMKIHQLIARMIAVDNQPLSVVSNDGFRAFMQGVEPRYKLPSESYLRQVAVPELCRSLKTKIAAVVEDVQYISLTTNTWTTSVCSESLMSLTGHWLDVTFTRRSAILQTSHLPVSHTAANIKTKFIDMVEDWKLDEKVCMHFVLFVQCETIISRAVPDLLLRNPAGAGFCRICKANPAGAGAGFQDFWFASAQL